MGDLIQPYHCPGDGRALLYTRKDFAHDDACQGTPLWSGQLDNGRAITTVSEDETLVSESSGAGWRKAKAQGELLPFTRYHVKRKRVLATGGTLTGGCYWLPHTSGRTASGEFCGFAEVRIPTPPETEQPDVASLLQSAWADAKSDAVDLLTEVAESPETVRMFKSYYDRFFRRSNRVSRDARNMRRREGRPITGDRVRSWSDDFQQAWMESRYGWRPLVGSANDIVDTWNTWKDSEEFTLRRYRKSETTGGGGEATIDHLIAGTSGYIGTGTTYSHTIKGRALVTTKIVRKSLATAVTINPLATAWEVVPYSFVVDWFLNTSDIVRAHWPVSAFAGSVACTSVKTTTRAQLGFKANYAADEGPMFTPCKFMYSVQEYNRTPRDSIPFRLTVGAKLSIAKILDLTIIFRQKLRKTGLRL